MGCQILVVYIFIIKSIERELFLVFFFLKFFGNLPKETNIAINLQ